MMLKFIYVALATTGIMSGTVFGFTLPQPPVLRSVQLGVPIYNTPRVLGQRVYLDSAQSTGPNVFALKNGKVLWRFATLGMIPMAPTLGTSMAMNLTAGMSGQKSKTQTTNRNTSVVFVASDIGRTHFMRALNANTGKWIWQYTRNKAPECMCSHSSHYSAGMLFAQTDGHSLYAFRPIGEQSALPRRLWQFPGNGARLTAPVLKNGLVVFGSADHNVYALRASDGKRIGVAETGYSFVAAPVIAENTVIIGNRGGTLHAYNLHSGRALWAFSANGPIDTPAVVRRGTVYFAAGRGDRNIYAMTLKTGRQIWNYQMADYTHFAPVLAGNMILAASRDGDLVALNAKYGQRIWDRALGGTPFSGPRVDGRLVLLKVGDHAIAAFGFKTGRPKWVYRTPAVVTAPAVAKSMVCVATSSGQVVAWP